MIVSTLSLLSSDDDILEHHLEHHLNNGVDAFIITQYANNDSFYDENIKNILKKYMKYILEVFIENTEYNQPRSTTKMALEAVKHQTDWIIHSNCDEFWYNLVILDDLDDNYYLRARHLINFLPYSSTDFAIANATKFESQQSESIFDKTYKIIHRPDPIIEFKHDMSINIKSEIAECDIMINRYPVRTYKQFEKKVIACQNSPGQWHRWYQDYCADKLRETFTDIVHAPNTIHRKDFV